MRQQFKEGEQGKNRAKKVAAGATGCETKGNATDIGVDEIDPAEFFDPEEFGVRRREAQRP
jgi:hypothetical protein